MNTFVLVTSLFGFREASLEIASAQNLINCRHLTVYLLNPRVISRTFPDINGLFKAGHRSLCCFLPLLAEMSEDMKIWWGRA